jgi:hypothetical protein
MNRFSFPLLIIYFVGFIYLALPSPDYPNVSGGALSDEPGDTWQNPDQKAFYTNNDRATVLADIESQFVVKAGNFSVPKLRLNYRPEEAQTLVRDQLQSYYLEEIVYPFRESIFVNGWEPKKSPNYANILPKDIPEISLRGVPYNAKITLKRVQSPVWARILVWTLTFPVSIVVYQAVKRTFSKNV